jgi:hypothetical protein
MERSSKHKGRKEPRNKLTNEFSDNYEGKWNTLRVFCKEMLTNDEYERRSKQSLYVSLSSYISPHSCNIALNLSSGGWIKKQTFFPKYNKIQLELPQQKNLDRDYFLAPSKELVKGGT